MRQRIGARIDHVILVGSDAARNQRFGHDTVGNMIGKIRQRVTRSYHDRLRRRWPVTVPSYPYPYPYPGGGRRRGGMGRGGPPMGGGGRGGGTVLYDAVLLAADELNSYRISAKPCGPGLPVDCGPQLDAANSAVGARMMIG